MRYTTWGPVDGGCGHAHRSIDAAERCLHRHRRHTRKLGNCTSRWVHRLDDEGRRLPLGNLELARLVDLEAARFEGRRR